MQVYIPPFLSTIILQNRTCKSTFHPFSLQLFYKTERARLHSTISLYNYSTKQKVQVYIPPFLSTLILQNRTCKSTFHPFSLQLSYKTEHASIHSTLSLYNYPTKQNVQVYIPPFLSTIILQNRTCKSTFHPFSLQLFYKTERARLHSTISLHNYSTKQKVQVYIPPFLSTIILQNRTCKSTIYNPPFLSTIRWIPITCNSYFLRGFLRDGCAALTLASTLLTLTAPRHCFAP